ncbi:MAG TPA: hypothetical protein VK668_13875 [Mucilaginibacter sp.]|nr:hypothetical protein [Mucilaginibacter sp.]
MKKLLIVSVLSLLFLCSYSQSSNMGQGITFAVKKSTTEPTLPAINPIEEIRTTPSIQPGKKTRIPGDICIVIFKQCDPKH